MKLVCETCGSDKILEKVWISTNKQVIVDDKIYFRVDEYYFSNGDTRFECKDCKDETCPVTEEMFITEKMGEYK